MSLKMNAEEIFALMERDFAAAARMDLSIDALSEGAITVSWPGAAKRLRPGGTISGPAMMTLVDVAAYFLVLAHIGPESFAVTTSLNINFLRKPAAGVLVAKSRMLKLGARLVVVEVELFVDEGQAPVAHATATYSVPPTPRSPEA